MNKKQIKTNEMIKLDIINKSKIKSYENNEKGILFSI